MDKQINDGGSLPAGMTMRDCFAVGAMGAFITGAISAGDTLRPFQDAKTAKRAYQIADAMLAARATEPTADADGWIEWGGGKRPVPADTRVEVRLCCGSEFTDVAESLRWDRRGEGDTVAYRIVRAGGAK